MKKRMPWTPDEDAVVFERYAIDGAKACAVSLGRSVAGLWAGLL